MRARCSSPRSRPLTAVRLTPCLAWRPRALGLGICLHAMLPAASVAQDPVPDTAARVLESLEVRGVRGNTVVGGASILVVRPDSARLGVAPTLATLMRTVPQVHVRTNSRGEVELSVRGSESRQVSVMMNGLPLSPSWDGRADPSLIPLSGVTEVRYVRSTATLLGGPNAIGGVVALQLGAPTGREQSLSLGSDATGARLVSASAGAARRTSAGGLTYWRVGGGYRALDGLVRAHDVADADPDGRLRTNTDLRHADGFATLGAQSARGAQYSLLVSGYDAERGVAPELHLAAPRLWRYPEQSRTAAQVRVQSRPLASTAGLTTVEASVGLLGARVRIASYSDPSYTTVSGRERGDEDVVSGRLAISQALPGGALLRSAFTLNHVRYDETLNAAATSRYAQALSSAGVEAEWQAGATTRLSAGVVIDAAQTLESGGKAASPDRSHVGWRVGASRPLDPTLQLHASVSERARFPALRELYSGSLNRFEPNPALRPERLIAAEAGATFGAADGTGVTAQVIAFHHRLDDAVVRVPFTGTTRFIRVNRDEVRSVGTEASVGWRDAAGRAVGLELMAQRVRVRDVMGGGTPQRPEHMPSVRALVDASAPLRGGVILRAELTHLGSQYCVNPETSSEVSLAAQSIAGASVQRSWAVSNAPGFRWLRTVLSIENLLDAAVYEQCGLPRAGRTLRIGVELR